MLLASLRNSVGQWFSEWSAQTSRSSITCEWVRNANPWAPPRPKTSETLGLGSSNLGFHKPNRRSWRALQVKGHRPSESPPNTRASSAWSKCRNGCSERKAGFQQQAFLRCLKSRRAPYNIPKQLSDWVKSLVFPCC